MSENINAFVFARCIGCNLLFCAHQVGKSSDDVEKDWPGREYGMAEGCLEVRNAIEPDTASILLFGSGCSKDHIAIAEWLGVTNICVTDFVNKTNTHRFVPLESDRRFDIVLACEVVEHFADPVKDFSRLFRFLSNTGLVCVSTNINDGDSDVAKHCYPSIPGHCSYYSPKSIQVIADTFGLQYDVRVPQCAILNRWPRKRFIYFFSDIRYYRAIAFFFARHQFAYSEERYQKHLQPAQLYLQG